MCTADLTCNKNKNQITLTNCYEPKDSSNGCKAWLNLNQQQYIEVSEATKAEMGAVIFFFFTLKWLKLCRSYCSFMPWNRFRQVRLQWISPVEKLKSLLLLRIEIISKPTLNKFKNKWLHELSKPPHRNDSTVGKYCFFLVLFLFNIQYKPAFLSSFSIWHVFLCHSL